MLSLPRYCLRLLVQQVHWCPSLSAAIVTQLVTRLQAPARTGLDPNLQIRSYWQALSNQPFQQITHPYTSARIRPYVLGLLYSAAVLLTAAAVARVMV